MLELTLTQARLLHLAAQGVVHKPRRKATPEAVEQAIARMQMLQIDTIHVVARSPYLVLFSRLGAYPQVWLDELLAAGRLAECWAHEASFVPAADYALHRAVQPLRHKHWARRRARWVFDEYPDEMQRLLHYIRDNGPVRSVDFKRRRHLDNGWWDWKPEKRWLEAWFALGELMVLRRERFQRVYDLAERVRQRHPVGVVPDSSEQARRLMLECAVRALGIARIHWIADYFRLSRISQNELDALCANGCLQPVTVRGWDRPAYVHQANADLLARVGAGRLRASHTTLLSPFDPVVWDRRRARELFDFDYRLECYVPAAKRHYGYFVLPILHRGRLIGRLDAKAQRRAGVFAVHAIYLQPDVAPTAALVRALAQAINRCASWHETPAVRIKTAQPSALLAPLRVAVSCS